MRVEIDRLYIDEQHKLVKLRIFDWILRHSISFLFKDIVTDCVINYSNVNFKEIRFDPHYRLDSMFIQSNPDLRDLNNKQH